MNTKRKIVLDRFIGAFVAFPLNFLVRFVGMIIGFDHSLEGEKKRIAIAKFKGMGSIIQATPLIKTLKERYPDATIVFVSSKENKGILERIDLIDELMFVNDKGVFSLLGSTTSLIFKLWKKRPDLYIDLEIYSNFSSIITTCSTAKDRFGYYLNSSKYRLGLYTHMMYFNTDAPIAQVYLQFARLLKCEKIETESYFFSEDSSLTNEIEDLQNYIVINPNASDLRIERRWPKGQFKGLITKIREIEPDKTIVLIGSPSEESYVSEVIEGIIDSRVVNMAGKTSLGGLIELIRNAELVITNDTGPMHVAASLRKKTIALFGPCSPQQYAISEHIYPIYKDLYCSPCVHEFIVPPCKGNNQCMKVISVEEVLKTLDKVRSGEKNTAYFKSKKYIADTSYPLGLVVRK